MGPALIIIVIFLVIWIVTNVIRAQQDAAQAAARRNVAQRPAGARAPEKTSNTDIDRFLQEIDRLRKKGQQPKEEQAPTAQAPLMRAQFVRI